MLSAAGIYSLMSITVSQRRKEIGIRMALGANRTRIIASIFARALGQLAMGAAAGAAVAAALEQGARPHFVDTLGCSGVAGEVTGGSEERIGFVVAAGLEQLLPQDRDGKGVIGPLVRAPARRHRRKVIALPFPGGQATRGAAFGMVQLGFH